jgi:spore coat polysaccharide biosynthesis protein SpsF
MKVKYKTEQEEFWAGNFGDDYVDRNNNSRNIARKTALFAKILAKTHGVSRFLELGANIGQNILAIKNLIPEAIFSAVEINDKAADLLEKIPNTKVIRGSILHFVPADLGQHDLTMTCGVLIHVNPGQLNHVYTLLYECSTSWIFINEYYNPTPVEVTYRGYAERLFKRDFAGEMLDKYPDLKLVDYGFQYSRDNNFPADDCTWFLMKKTVM